MRVILLSLVTREACRITNSGVQVGWNHIRQGHGRELGCQQWLTLHREIGCVLSLQILML